LPASSAPAESLARAFDKAYSRPPQAPAPRASREASRSSNNFRVSRRRSSSAGVNEVERCAELACVALVPAAPTLADVPVPALTDEPSPTRPDAPVPAGAGVVPEAAVGVPLVALRVAAPAIDVAAVAGFAAAPADRADPDEPALEDPAPAVLLVEIQAEVLPPAATEPAAPSAGEPPHLLSSAGVPAVPSAPVESPAAPCADPEGELDVIAVFKGSTTAATSGGSSRVSKRGNQKYSAAAAPAPNPNKTQGQRLGGIGSRRDTFGNSSSLTSPQATGDGAAWTTSRVKIDVGSGYVPTVTLSVRKATGVSTMMGSDILGRCCVAPVPSACLGGPNIDVPDEVASAVEVGREAGLPSMGHIGFVGASGGGVGARVVSLVAGTARAERSSRNSFGT
jgi:hypothetical protein